MCLTTTMKKRPCEVLVPSNQGVQYVSTLYFDPPQNTTTSMSSNVSLYDNTLSENKK